MEKRLQHAQYILEFLNYSGAKDPQSKDLLVFCGDSHIRTYPLLLGAVSKFVRELMTDPSVGEDFCLIVPDLSVSHFETFFRYVFSRDVSAIFSDEDILRLKEVFQALQFDSKFSFFSGDPIDYDDHDSEIREPVNYATASRTLRKKRPQKITREPGSNKKRAENLSCRFCSKSYRHTKAKNKHLLSEHFERCKEEGLIHPCKMCGAYFVGPRGLEKHIVRLHGSKSQPVRVMEVCLNDDILKSVSQYECPFHVGEHFRATTLKDFKYHIKEVHPDKDKSCYACGEDCGTRESLENHIQSHLTTSKESRYFHNCEYCHMKFLSEYNLVIHKRDEHSDSLTMQCKVCKKEFKNKKFLKAHESQHLHNHSSTVPSQSSFQCLFSLDDGTLCEKTFGMKANLDRHIRSHQKIKNHSCSECGKLFVDSTRLKEHRWIHSDHRPFSCRFCTKSFRHQNHVRNHEANVHGEAKSFSCEICKKRFVYAYQLKTHIKSHRGNERELTELVLTENASLGSEEEANSVIETIFQCSVCQEVTPSFAKLQEHCQRHSEADAREEPAKNDFFIDISEFQNSTGAPQNQFVVVYDVPSYN